MNSIKHFLVVAALFLLAFSITAIALNDYQQPLNFWGGAEIASPSDWVSEDQIKVYDDTVILQLTGATWAKFTDTNSMDPFLDDGANAIEIMPDSAEDIQVGDIISYQTDSGIIIHRVIEVGEDNDGIYYTVQGDNNSFADPVKVRYSDVVGVLVAIIY
ncbi:MAG: signal peptidase I [Nanoarchaeota archaeon]|nr:signal peptidase I [Nanoarchaeota archaeon]